MTRQRHPALVLLLCWSVFVALIVLADCALRPALPSPVVPDVELTPTSTRLPLLTVTPTPTAREAGSPTPHYTKTPQQPIILDALPMSTSTPRPTVTNTRVPEPTETPTPNPARPVQRG